MLKKLIIFVDRGNISRSPVAASIARKELEKRNLEKQYDIISTRTQGIAPDDKEPPKFPKFVDGGR